MNVNQSYNKWINSALEYDSIGKGISSFVNILNEKFEELSASGFLCLHETKGGIFSPENRQYEIRTKTGSLATYSAGLNTEAKYLRDIFNRKTLVIAEGANKLSKIHLFAYEAPLLRLEGERDIRFRISADLVGINDYDEIFVIETKLPSGDALDKAILQAFGYAYFLSKQLANNHNDVIEHAKRCMKKFHVHEEMTQKIKNGTKIKYMIAAPYAYFSENIYDSAVVQSTDNLLAELNEESIKSGFPEFAGFTVIENIHLNLKNVSGTKNSLNSFSTLPFCFQTENFSSNEKTHQVSLKKRDSAFFSEQAKALGEYKKYMVDYCLPNRWKKHNLFEDIRECAYEHFSKNKIKWHSLGENHLLSSQAYCVNFLFPFNDSPEALKELLLPHFPDIETMLPIEGQSYIAFEWNGGKNYLQEHRYSHNKRGEYATYPDAAVMYLAKDGVKKIVLIEWKYTETYSSKSKTEGQSGMKRLDTYRPFFQLADCPVDLGKIDKDFEKAMESLFYEPFYQLFREQLLAREIEKDSANDIQKVTVLHISPKANKAYLNNVTSPDLAALFPEENVIEIWRKLIQNPDDFVSVDQKTLFRKFIEKPISEKFLKWQEYIITRYRL